MKAFSLKIVTPDAIVYDGMATGILLRTGSGDVEILAGHADLVASVATGRVRIRTESGDRIAAASGGFLSVQGGTVSLVTTTFEYREGIDLARAEAAKTEAEAAMQNRSSDADLDRLQAKLQRAITRIRVGSER